MTRSPKNGRLALMTIYLTFVLDAAGIGLVLPVLPDLFGEVSGKAMGVSYGLFLSLYALMQFVFSPLLGGLSDRFGRRPVLIASTLGAAVNYGIMAALPPLWLLFIGRAVAGVTGASMAVASAYVTDISTPEQRASRFGQLSACFGVGFILGPAAGGILREFGLGWPFGVAAVLSLANLVLVMLVLPESRKQKALEEGAPPPAPFTPLSPLKDIRLFKSISVLLLVAGLFALIGEIGGSVWVLYVEHKFHWQGMTVGLSLALFGLFHALAQAFIVGPLTKRLGERGALLTGMAADMIAYLGLALIVDGRWVFALIPVLCVGGVGQSVLQAVISHRVDEDRQGQLQGVLASLASLAAIIGPVLILNLYFLTRDVFPGLVWIVGVGVYCVCLPLVARRSIYKPADAPVHRTAM